MRKKTKKEPRPGIWFFPGEAMVGKYLEVRWDEKYQAWNVELPDKILRLHTPRARGSDGRS